MTRKRFTELQRAAARLYAVTDDYEALLSRLPALLNQAIADVIREADRDLIEEARANRRKG